MIAAALTALDLAPPPSDYVIGGLAIAVIVALVGGLGFLVYWLVKRGRKR
jgi:hypothetical protein